MVLIKVNQRGVITLPKKLRTSLGITEGGLLGVREKDGTLVLEPQQTSTDPVLIDIRNGLQEIQQGKYIEFGSVTELHTKAKRYAD